MSEKSLIAKCTHCKSKTDIVRIAELINPRLR